YFDDTGDYSVDKIYSIVISVDGNYLFTNSREDDYVSIMQVKTSNEFPTIKWIYPAEANTTSFQSGSLKTDILLNDTSLYSYYYNITFHSNSSSIIPNK
ncbi:unnamed protein product, partial [marine sediment metagenome]